MVKPVNFVKCRLGQVVLETRPINGYLSPLLPSDGFLMMSADVLIQLYQRLTDRQTDGSSPGHIPRYAYACCVRRAVKLQQKRGVCFTWYDCTFGCSLSFRSSCYNVSCTDMRRTERGALLNIADVSPALYANDYELGKWHRVLFSRSLIAAASTGHCLSLRV